MSILGASQTLVELLSNQLRASQELGGYTVELYTTKQFKSPADNRISLFLYRVDIDEARRQVELSGANGSASRPLRRFALGLELYYLLTVWGKGSASGEHEMLQACMNVFEEFAIVSGDLLDSNQTDWEPNESLRITLAQLSNEDMLRLWDSLESPYQLSVSYVVRTVRLRPRITLTDVATTRTLALGGQNDPSSGNTP